MGMQNMSDSEPIKTIHAICGECKGECLLTAQQMEKARELGTIICDPCK